jgi:predicted acyl esterase
MRTFPASALIITLLATSLRAQTVLEDTVTMRDGVLLEATIIIPSDSLPAGGFPGVVLVHGYGGKKDDMRILGMVLAANRYASLAYSVRGQGNSGGFSTTSGETERLDLDEVVQHFRKHPSVNPDKIGVAGGSQGGIHSWMAAVFRMAGVKAVVPSMATPHFAADLVPNNCIKQALAWQMSLGTVRYGPDRDRVRDLIIADEYDSVLTYINARDLERLLDSVQIPVLQGLGWKDALFPANAGIRAAASLSSRGIPVWSYYGTNGHLEPINFDEFVYFLTLSVDWFDRWLIGEPLDQSDIPMVFYADDRPDWPHHVTPHWPPDSAGVLRLHIRGHSLVPPPPGSNDTLHFSVAYDSTYTPATGWNDLYKGPGFQNAFKSSPVRFLSAPLLDTADVTGIPRVHLIAASDAPQFQSHTRLFDVSRTDTGLVWQLMTRGIHGIRGNSPYATVNADVECFALSHRIPPGHMIGLEVTSLDVDASGDAYIIPYFHSANSRVYSFPTNPSFVDIPLIGSVGLTRIDEPVAALPNGFLLHQNYPNPFNASTTVRYELPDPARVRLSVYDMLGREVSVLVNDRREAGFHQVRFDPGGLASGVYFYRLQAGEFTQTRKLVIVK